MEYLASLYGLQQTHKQASEKDFAYPALMLEPMSCLVDLDSCFDIRICSSYHSNQIVNEGRLLLYYCTPELGGVIRRLPMT